MTKDNLTARLQYPGVMVSSTYTDLKDHRDAVIRAIESQQLKAIGMDYDTAKPAVDVIESSLEMVHGSSAYVLIIGHKYGQIPDSPDRNPGRLSLTELEFTEAVSIGLPVLLFIMGDEHSLKRRDVETDMESSGKLEAFRVRAKKMADDSQVERVYKVFNSFQEFEVEINRAIAGLRHHFDQKSEAGEAIGPRPEAPPSSPVSGPAGGVAGRTPHYSIQSRTQRELVEFRFTELLKPVLNDLKAVLNVPVLALTFLPQRNGSIVPNLNIQDYDNYDKIKNALLEEGNRFRDLEVSSAVVNDGEGHVIFHNRLWNTQALRNLNTILQNEAANWAGWVNNPLSEQVRQWLDRPGKEIVCSLKYIPSTENRDVVGHIIVPRQHRARKPEAADQDVGEKVQRLIEDHLLPVLRHLVLELAESKVQGTSSRNSILDTILEAAVSLSGADWGCIKSSTLGAASIEVDSEKKCEKAKAVCVHNCPRFFHEGRLVETEELVARAIEENEDMVLDLSADTRKSFQHPAAQMAVFLIHDPEGVIEPQLPDSDVVGAIVVQHTEPTYLQRFKALYGPYLQEFAKLTARTTRAAASKSLVSILKRKITGEQTGSFEEKIAFVVNWVASGNQSTWVLLQPVGRRFKVMHQSPNQLGGLRDVLFELIGAEESVDEESQLAAFVCNSTMSFMMINFHHSTRPIQLKRVGINEYGAFAYFNEEFREAEGRLRQQGENRVIFNLGRQYKWQNAEHGKERRVSFVIGPIVSPTGSPLGVLAVLREINERDIAPWNPHQLENFEARLATLRDDLYLSYLELNKISSGPADA